MSIATLQSRQIPIEPWAKARGGQHAWTMIDNGLKRGPFCPMPVHATLYVALRSCVLPSRSCDASDKNLIIAPKFIGQFHPPWRPGANKTLSTPVFGMAGTPISEYWRVRILETCMASIKSPCPLPFPFS